MVTTLGYERLYNVALGFDDRERFIAFMNDGQPVRPANILKIVEINQGAAPLTLQNPRPSALDASEFARHREQGCFVIDGRNPTLFGAAHIPESYNIAAGSPEFEQRVGWVAPLNADLLLIVANDHEAAAAAYKMAFIGLDHRVRGYLAGGMAAWRQAGHPIAELPQTSVHDLATRLPGDNDLTVLDVREPEEWDAGHIANAANMSYKVLEQRLAQLRLDPDEPIAVVCAGGVRSSTACSILLRNGFRNLVNVSGGMGAWRSAGLPTVGSNG